MGDQATGMAVQTLERAGIECEVVNSARLMEARVDLAAEFLTLHVAHPSSVLDAVLGAVSDGQPVPELEYGEDHASFLYRCARECSAVLARPLPSSYATLSEGRTAAAVRWLADTAPRKHPPIAPGQEMVDRSVSAATPRPVASGECSPMTQSTVTPSRATAEDKLTDLECRVAWLKRQFELERRMFEEREAERKLLLEQSHAKQRQVLEEERDQQKLEIQELTDVLGAHQRLVGRLHEELEEMIHNGPTPEDRTRHSAAIRIQAVMRGHLARGARKRQCKVRKARQQETRLTEAALGIQKVFRGHLGRKKAQQKKATR
eukprot:Hpha_TRINITY_DN16050_c1_g1::TRINITY_DN16050_c1_g1_i1::g.121478::m.121478